LAVRLRLLNGNPLGGWGSVVGNPFSITSISLGVRARSARLVVLVPVVPAWFHGSWCGLPVVPSVVVCVRLFLQTPVVPV
jgi:hypothetical protein